MGVLGLPFAEEYGGMGAGPVEVAVVAEEIGRVLAPEPFVEAVVLAGGLVAAVGTDEQRAEILGALADGGCVPAVAHAEPGTRWSDAAGSVTATDDDGRWRLTGVKAPVLNGARADLLVVSAVADDGTGLFVVRPDADGLVRTGYRTHDGGRAATVTFDRTPAEPLGGSAADRTGAIRRALAEARIAYNHEAVGAMDTALRTSVDYLRTRKQFGVTLNKFQALTFRAADMYVSLELARSTALWATMVIDAGGDVVSAADRARLQVSRASRHIGQEAIQLHGGIGMTAEYKIGHYTSRLTAIDHVLGDGDWALARLAGTVDDHPTVDPLSAPYVR
jgi:alkylation response protein AidB-like acyl-CoA dehydrogenase